MSDLHDPGNPKHARLFELLRQEHDAATTVARVRNFTIRKVSADEAEQIKAVARKSLRFQA